MPSNNWPLSGLKAVRPRRCKITWIQKPQKLQSTHRLFPCILYSRQCISVFPGCQRLFMRGLRFRSSLYDDPRLASTFGRWSVELKPINVTKGLHYMREKKTKTTKTNNTNKQTSGPQGDTSCKLTWQKVQTIAFVKRFQRIPLRIPLR